MMPSLRQFDAFVRAAHLGSFNRAAEQMALSQPAFSQLISQLEGLLGARLFERTSRMLRLTPEGERLLPRAERVLRDMQETLIDFRKVSEQKYKKLSIGALPLITAHLVAPLVEDFRHRYQDIHISIDDAHAEALNRGVELGTLDLALSIKPDRRPELSFQPVFRDRFQIVLPSHHPLAQKKVLRWDDLRSENFIYFRPGSGGQATLLRSLSEAGVLLEPAMDMHQSWSLLAMVDAGLGFTVLPAVSCRLEAYPRLCVCEVEGPVVERQVGVVTASKRVLTPPAINFRDLFISFAAQLKGVTLVEQV